MRTWKLVLTVTILILALTSVISISCAKPAPAPAPAPAPTTAPAPAPAPVPAPKPTTAPAPAPGTETAADFYKKNPVTVIITTSAGGTVDIAGRLFAAYWNQVTGGNMVVENEAGGAGIAGINKVYAAKPDGLTIGFSLFGPHIFSPAITADPSVKYDIRKLQWIGSFWNEPNLFTVSTKLAAQNMADVQKMSGFKFGALAPTATSSLADALVIDVFGLKDAKIITGLRASDLGLVLGKGEVDGAVWSGAASLDYVAKGYTKPVFLAVHAKRTSWLPNVPSVSDLATLTPLQEKLLRAVESASYDRVIEVAPGVPADRVEFMRAAFLKVLAIKELQDKALQTWPTLTTPVSGKDWATFVEQSVQSVSKEDFTTLANMVTKSLPIK